MQLEKLEKAIEKDMKQLLQTIDGSIHPLREWLIALDFINNWVMANRRKVSNGKLIGYLACCSESVANFSPSPELVEVTREMLDAHGMD